MHAIIETDVFLRQMKSCGVSPEEREEIIHFIAANPQAGHEIPGTGGMRKVRFARTGQGKSGGYRVITFYTGLNIPVFLVSVYAKNIKENIDPAEKNVLKTLARFLSAYGQGEKQA